MTNLLATLPIAAPIGSLAPSAFAPPRSGGKPMTRTKTACRALVAAFWLAGLTACCAVTLVGPLAVASDDANALLETGLKAAPNLHSQGAPSHYEKTVLEKKPIAYWRLGESKGPIVLDRTGNGHKGMCHGTPAFQEKGALKGDPDTAVKLDGKKSYIEIPSHKDFSQPTSGKGLTVEVWVRPDVLDFEGETADPYIFWLGKGEQKQQEWALRFYSAKSKDRPNRISAYIFNPDGGLGAGAYFQDKLTAGEWIHVVACFDPGDSDTKGAGVHIYKNGVHRLGPPSAGVLYNNPQWQIKPEHGTAPLRLGTRDTKSFLSGGLDEAAIYRRVLSSKEILENYNAGMGK